MRNLKNTSTASSKLLLAAKSLVSDPNAPNAKNSLANAARYVHAYYAFQCTSSAVYVFIPVKFFGNNRYIFLLRVLLFSFVYMLILLIQMVCQLCSCYSCNRLCPLCYRAVTDSINMLLNACMSAAPGQKECDNALRNIQV